MKNLWEEARSIIAKAVVEASIVVLGMFIVLGAIYILLSAYIDFLKESQLCQ